jgi:translation initiation factor IF-3
LNWRLTIAVKGRYIVNEKQKVDSLRTNGEIVGVPEVRLIGQDGEAVGIVSIAEALAAAREQMVDLVEISPKVEPPVCKLMNYGKFLYEQQKKKHDAKKKQKIVELKEIQLRPVISQHDLDVKLRAAIKFIEQGDKVKFVMKFRGREFSHQEIGLDFLNKIVENLSEVAKVEALPKLEGKQYIVILCGK